MLKLKKRKRSLLMSDINIIPFTDILLVVLIAFIVATPLLVESSIKVKLPRTELNSAIAKENIINISINGKDMIFLNGSEVSSLDMLGRALQAPSLGVGDKVVVISADESINYGIVAKVLALAREKGAVRLELAVESVSK